MEFKVLIGLWLVVLAGNAHAALRQTAKIIGFAVDANLFTLCGDTFILTLIVAALLFIETKHMNIISRLTYPVHEAF